LKKRITVSLDEELFRRIKKEQTKLLKKSAGPISFSAVLSHHLRNGLKNHQTLTPRKSKKS